MLNTLDHSMCLYITHCFFSSIIIIHTHSSSIIFSFGINFECRVRENNRKMGNIGKIANNVDAESSKVVMPLPLLSMNHVSFVCRNVQESVKFYVNILGFVLIKRPSSFKFQGAWLFNYGIGIHLLESDKVAVRRGEINPKENHISFQCSDMKIIMDKLDGMKIEYVRAVVEEGGIEVDQVFFHDPDGYMIEICNCQNLPVLPISACPLNQPNNRKIQAPVPFEGKKCSAQESLLMMEKLMIDLFWISI
ncbi:glyoxylase I 4-like [Vicia villosa]|uniref:glyoxylase I 4-like n=1 Tax=Vicia villosa TaxID=3911 RepID=UPI00273B10EF|nr:glyoxylase I 4-like [Vicia villosa]